MKFPKMPFSQKKNPPIPASEQTIDVTPITPKPPGVVERIRNTVKKARKEIKRQESASTADSAIGLPTPEATLPQPDQSEIRSQNVQKLVDFIDPSKDLDVIKKFSRGMSDLDIVQAIDKYTGIRINAINADTETAPQDKYNQISQVADYKMRLVQYLNTARNTQILGDLGVQTGESLSTDQLADLIRKYPDLNDQIGLLSKDISDENIREALDIYTENIYNERYAQLTNPDEQAAMQLRQEVKNEVDQLLITLRSKVSENTNTNSENAIEEETLTPEAFAEKIVENLYNNEDYLAELAESMSPTGIEEAVNIAIRKLYEKEVSALDPDLGDDEIVEIQVRLDNLSYTLRDILIPKPESTIAENPEIANSENAIEEEALTPEAFAEKIVENLYDDEDYLAELAKSMSPADIEKAINKAISAMYTNEVSALDPDLDTDQRDQSQAEIQVRLGDLLTTLQDKLIPKPESTNPENPEIANSSTEENPKTTVERNKIGKGMALISNALLGTKNKISNFVKGIFKKKNENRPVAEDEDSTININLLRNRDVENQDKGIEINLLRNRNQGIASLEEIEPIAKRNIFAGLNDFSKRLPNIDWKQVDWEDFKKKAIDAGLLTTTVVAGVGTIYVAAPVLISALGTAHIVSGGTYAVANLLGAGSFGTFTSLGVFGSTGTIASITSAALAGGTAVMGKITANRLFKKPEVFEKEENRLNQSKEKVANSINNTLSATRQNLDQNKIDKLIKDRLNQLYSYLLITDQINVGDPLPDTFLNDGVATSLEDFANTIYTENKEALENGDFDKPIEIPSTDESVNEGHEGENKENKQKLDNAILKQITTLLGDQDYTAVDSNKQLIEDELNKAYQYIKDGDYEDLLTKNELTNFEITLTPEDIDVAKKYSIFTVAYNSTDSTGTYSKTSLENYQEIIANKIVDKINEISRLESEEKRKEYLKNQAAEILNHLSDKTDEYKLDYINDNYSRIIDAFIDQKFEGPNLFDEVEYALPAGYDRNSPEASNQYLTALNVALHKLAESNIPNSPDTDVEGGEDRTKHLKFESQILQDKINRFTARNSDKSLNQNVFDVVGEGMINIRNEHRELNIAGKNLIEELEDELGQDFNFSKIGNAEERKTWGDDGINTFANAAITVLNRYLDNPIQQPTPPNPNEQGNKQEPSNDSPESPFDPENLQSEYNKQMRSVSRKLFVQIESSENTEALKQKATENLTLETLKHIQYFEKYVEIRNDFNKKFGAINQAGPSFDQQIETAVRNSNPGNARWSIDSIGTKGAPGKYKDGEKAFIGSFIRKLSKSVLEPKVEQTEQVEQVESKKTPTNFEILSQKLLEKIIEKVDGIKIKGLDTAEDKIENSEPNDFKKIALVAFQTFKESKDLVDFYSSPFNRELEKKIKEINDKWSLAIVFDEIALPDRVKRRIPLIKKSDKIEIGKIIIEMVYPSSKNTHPENQAHQSEGPNNPSTSETNSTTPNIEEVPGGESGTGETSGELFEGEIEEPHPFNVPDLKYKISTFIDKLFSDETYKQQVSDEIQAFTKEHWGYSQNPFNVIGGQAAEISLVQSKLLNGTFINSIKPDDFKTVIVSFLNQLTYIDNGNIDRTYNANAVLYLLLNRMPNTNIKNELLTFIKKNPSEGSAKNKPAVDAFIKKLSDGNRLEEYQNAFAESIKKLIV